MQASGKLYIIKVYEIETYKNIFLGNAYTSRTLPLIYMYSQISAKEGRFDT